MQQLTSLLQSLPLVRLRQRYRSGYGNMRLPSPDESDQLRPPRPKEMSFEIVRHCKSEHLSSLSLILGDDSWMTPFQQPSFTRHWQRTIGDQIQVEPITVIFSLREAQIAIFQLAIEHRLGLRILTWHASPVSDYGTPIVLQPHLADFAALDGHALLDTIVRAVGAVDLVYLPKQPAWLRDKSNPLVLSGSVKHHTGAHAINFIAGETWEQFLARKRSPSSLKQLRKKRRYLDKLGQVEIRFAQTSGDARPIVEHCLTAKSHQLARLGHYDPFSSEVIRNSLIDYFSNEIGKSTWAIALCLDGELTASAIGLAQPTNWLVYQLAMDSGGAARHSPGTHLLLALMQHCIETGISRLDLALGDQAYKFDWCDEHMELMTSCLPVTLRGKLAATAFRITALAKLYIASNRKMYNFGKNWKRHIQRLTVGSGSS